MVDDRHASASTSVLFISHGPNGPHSTVRILPVPRLSGPYGGHGFTNTPRLMHPTDLTRSTRTHNPRRPHRPHEPPRSRPAQRAGSVRHEPVWVGSGRGRLRPWVGSGQTVRTERKPRRQRLRKPCQKLGEKPCQKCVKICEKVCENVKICEKVCEKCMKMCKKHM